MWCLRFVDRRGRRGDIHIDSYPDLVLLAAAIAAYRPILIHTALGDAAVHHKSVEAFLRTIMNAFEFDTGATQLTAVTAWVADQRIIARRADRATAHVERR